MMFSTNAASPYGQMSTSTVERGFSNAPSYASLYAHLCVLVLPGGVSPTPALALRSEHASWLSKSPCAKQRASAWLGGELLLVGARLMASRSTHGCCMALKSALGCWSAAIVSLADMQRVTAAGEATIGEVQSKPARSVTKDFSSKLAMFRSPTPTKAS